MENAIRNNANAILTFEEVFSLAMKAPGVKVNRADFLRKELNRYCLESQVQAAINTNPAKAGIDRNIIDKIAKQVINYESMAVTSISFVTSLPGGTIGGVAVAADITSYYACIIRVMQKLAYLYGFKEFDFSDNSFDSETMNILYLFFGIMFGVQNANTALKTVADLMVKQVSKKLARKALTKGTIYPIVKKISVSIGARMTKQIFADGVASTLPIVGGFLSGGLTLAAFMPCCKKLQKELMSYNLCNPHYYNVIDAEVSRVVEY